MPRLASAVLASAVLFAACRSNSFSESPADRAALMAATEQYKNSWLLGDTAMALGVLSDSVKFMLQGGPDISGMKDARAFIIGQMEQFKVPALQVSRDEVVMRGDRAIEVGTYEETVAPKTGAPQRFAGRYLIIWSREPNGWRILRFMVNSPDPRSAMPAQW